MIFIDNLKSQSSAVKKRVGELFETAFNNQSHPQDLLLVAQHGFYNPEFAETEIIAIQIEKSIYLTQVSHIIKSN